MSAIGSLNESPLHASLKRLLAPPGSSFEVKLGGYVIDAVADDLLIEVQTRNFGAMRTKLAALLPEHRVRLILPVAQRRWLVKHHADGSVQRRRSPLSGGPQNLFAELVYGPELFAHPHLEIELVLIEEEEHRRHEPGKAWRRRGWVVHDRSLVSVLGRHHYRHPPDLLSLLPGGLPEPFGTADVADLGGWSRRLAQQAAYCLVALQLAERVGKQGNAHLYRLAQTTTPRHPTLP
jgi:hypothetical protein